MLDEALRVDEYTQRFRVLCESSPYGAKLEHMNLAIELEQEDDGRWIAEIDDLNGVLVYGETREDAVRKVKTLALRVIADRLENGEDLPQQIESLLFQAA